jgi:trimethylamine:corrinoid methyltransferase-like protein
MDLPVVSSSEGAVAPYGVTSQLQPFLFSYRLSIRHDERLKQVKATTLHILEEAAIHCPSEGTLSIYAELGAQADSED